MQPRPRTLVTSCTFCHRLHTPAEPLAVHPVCARCRPPGSSTTPAPPGALPFA